MFVWLHTSSCIFSAACVHGSALLPEPFCGAFFARQLLPIVQSACVPELRNRAFPLHLSAPNAAHLGPTIRVTLPEAAK
eukprot:s1332_g19.t1